MLQALLADRFKLVVRKDVKPLPAFVLSVGKGQPKLKPANDPGEPGCRPQPPDPSSEPYVSFVCRGVTMQELATRLKMSAAPYLNYPVVDSTGLKGAWDFEIGWTPRGEFQRSGGVSVFEAVDKQLGLKLEQQNVPTDVIVVDRVNQNPTENAPGVAAKLGSPTPTEFEVASLKLSDPDGQPGGYGIEPGGRVDFRHVPLRIFITMAWDLDPRDELVGAPKWLNSTFVDLVAKAPKTSDRVDTGDLPPMLKSLLTERFKMQTHFEERPISAYTLVALKPKLQKADPANRTRCKTERIPPAGTIPAQLHAVCQNMTMAHFAQNLPTLAPSYLHYSVPDATGIEGVYDFAFIFSPALPGGGGGGRNGGGSKGGGDPTLSGAGDAASEPSGAISLFDALTKQLGLKLEMEKRTMPVFVIDRIEPKPVEN
jgi:uncharacterized protein (TIGR03435 family)